MLIQSCLHQFVMDVVLVGLEERAAVVDAHEHHPHYIKHRHDEHGDGEDEPVFVVTHYHGIIHGKLHEEEAEDETQGKAAGVAHEDFADSDRTDPRYPG